MLMAAAVANLTLLAATAGQSSDAASPAPGALALLVGLLVLLSSRALGPEQPPDVVDAVRLIQTSARGRQRSPLPTALSMPGCRPDF